MRILLIIAGFMSLALGIIGAFVPLLPTTPFVLLSAFLFSKSSDRFYTMLISSPLFGPSIKEWNEHGVISIRAKILSTLSILAVLIYLNFFKVYPVMIKVVITISLTTVITFVTTRPSRKKEN